VCAYWYFLSSGLTYVCACVWVCVDISSPPTYELCMYIYIIRIMYGFYLLVVVVGRVTSSRPVGISSKNTSLYTSHIYVFNVYIIYIYIGDTLRRRRRLSWQLCAIRISREREREIKKRDRKPETHSSLYLESPLVYNNNISSYCFDTLLRRSFPHVTFAPTGSVLLPAFYDTASSSTSPARLDQSYFPNSGARRRNLPQRIPTTIIFIGYNNDDVFQSFFMRTSR